MKMTAHLVASIKMKNLKEITACILESDGLDAEAKEMRDAGRLTVALIDRTCKATDVGDFEETTEVEPTLDEDEVEHKEPVSDGFDDVRKAIKKGKGKKAIKLCKAHKENGSRGSVLNKLLDEAKAL